MANLETVKAAYAAFAHNDPSVLFGAMDPAVRWYQAEGNPLADRNPYVGTQAIGEGVFGPPARGDRQFQRRPGHLHRCWRPHRYAGPL